MEIFISTLGAGGTLIALAIGAALVAFVIMRVSKKGLRLQGKNGEVFQLGDDTPFEKTNARFKQLCENIEAIKSESDRERERSDKIASFLLEIENRGASTDRNLETLKEEILEARKARVDQFNALRGEFEYNKTSLDSLRSDLTEGLRLAGAARDKNQAELSEDIGGVRRDMSEVSDSFDCLRGEIQTIARALDQVESRQQKMIFYSKDQRDVERMVAGLQYVRQGGNGVVRADVLEFANANRMIYDSVVFTMPDLELKSSHDAAPDATTQAENSLLQ